MDRNVAIVGAGVSGLTCGVVFAERGLRTVIFAKETGQQTTSGAAAAVWFPYDAQPEKKVIPWALKTYQTLAGSSSMPASGVSMIELRQFSRTARFKSPIGQLHSALSSVIPSKVEGSGNSLGVDSRSQFH